MPEPQGDIRPNPDPTYLTTTALVREVRRLEHRMDERIEALKLLQDTAVQGARDYAQMQDQIRDERLQTVNATFSMIERQRIELKVDNEKALAQALGYSQETLQALEERYQVGHTALIVAMDDLKVRVTAFEATRSGGRQLWAFIVGGLGLLAMGMTAIFNFVQLH